MVPHSIFTASHLMKTAFPEPKWAIEGLVADGLTLLVGAPKLGKSWAALDWAVSVATGEAAFGTLPTVAGDVLFLALEDVPRRLRDRLDALLDADAAPENLHIATSWPEMAGGGLQLLGEWLDDHPDARLVIIDTLARVRGAVSGNAHQYTQDYRTAATIKALADAHGVAIVVVHHTRKMVADDPLETVSGTHGLAGAADTAIVLRREKSGGASLYVRGRDVPEMDVAMVFDRERSRWKVTGDAAVARLSSPRQTILETLRAAAQPLAPKEVSARIGRNPASVRRLLAEMARAGTLVNSDGRYSLPDVAAQSAAPHAAASVGNRVPFSPPADIPEENRPSTARQANVVSGGREAANEVSRDTHQQASTPSSRALANTTSNPSTPSRASTPSANPVPARPAENTPSTQNPDNGADIEHTARGARPARLSGELTPDEQMQAEVFAAQLQERPETVRERWIAEYHRRRDLGKLTPSETRIAEHVVGLVWS